ncbi:MAG: 50S ribosomal protein L5 [Candidatus Diapherotrites archaeon]|nr:50S ribosomal protein L5 [Candidatus Diapherotrites archaeon]
MKEDNVMREIRIQKVTVNMGVGESGEALDRAAVIMQQITGRKPIKTKCKVKQPTWGIREGLEIGLKVTLRKKAAEEFLKRALIAKQNILNKKNFDKFGNFGFGIKEHIELPGIKYDPKLGIRGFDVLVTLERPGYRIKNRKIKKAKIGKNQKITKEEAIEFMKKKFGVEINE